MTDLRQIVSEHVQELATMLNQQTKRGAEIAVDALLSVVRENVAGGGVDPDEDGPTWNELETMLERVRHAVDRLDPVPSIELVHRVAGRDFDGSAADDDSSSPSSRELAADRSPDPGEPVDDDPAIDDEPPIGSFPWERPDPIEPIDEPSDFDAWERSY